MILSKKSIAIILVRTAYQESDLNSEMLNSLAVSFATSNSFAKDVKELLGYSLFEVRRGMYAIINPKI